MRMKASVSFGMIAFAAAVGIGFAWYKKGH